MSNAPEQPDWRGMTTDDDLLDALCRTVLNKPATFCDWRDVLRVRDAVHDVLNRAINAKQAGDVIAAPGARRDRTGEPIDDEPHPPDPRAAARQHLHRTLGWEQ